MKPCVHYFSSLFLSPHSTLHISPSSHVLVLVRSAGETITLVFLLSKPQTPEVCSPVFLEEQIGPFGLSVEKSSSIWRNHVDIFLEYPDRYDISSPHFFGYRLHISHTMLDTASTESHTSPVFSPMHLQYLSDNPPTFLG